jgi:hypothetical protein
MITTITLEDLLTEAISRRRSGDSTADAARSVLKEAWLNLEDNTRFELACRGFYDAINAMLKSNPSGGGAQNPNGHRAMSAARYLEAFKCSFGDRSVSILDMTDDERAIEIARTNARLEGNQKRLTIFESLDATCKSCEVATARELPAMRLEAIAALVRDWRKSTRKRAGLSA